MAIVNQLDKKAKMSNWDAIKIQVVLHCHLNKVAVSDSDVNCLTLLAKEGPSELTSFCNKAYEDFKIFSSVQTVRNCLAKLEKKNLVVKDGKNKKQIYPHPSIGLITEGNILLDYKFLALESA
jgi:hypothetical protein